MVRSTEGAKEKKSRRPITTYSKYNNAHKKSDFNNQIHPPSPVLFTKYVHLIHK